MKRKIVIEIDCDTDDKCEGCSRMSDENYDCYCTVFGECADGNERLPECKFAEQDYQELVHDSNVLEQTQLAGYDE